MRRWLAFALALAASLAAVPAQAAITCSAITSPGASFNYVNGTTMTVQSTFTVTCNRSSTSDATTLNYDVTVNNGTQPSGQNNRANLGTAMLRYDFFTNSSCGTSWKGTRKISGTLNWGSSATTGTLTGTQSYWACITTAQTATASGMYADTVTMTLDYGATNVTGSAGVAIYAPATCSLTTAAGNLTLNYTAFSASPQSANTTVGFTCTNGMPYTLATDVQEGVLAGLRYILSLSQTTANGTGALQSYTITATIPAGQAGSCPTGSCNATQTHTITVTY